MSALWSSAEIEAATLGHTSAPFSATGISIDTRTLQPGDLFVALQGDSRDGHVFVPAAFAAQAAAVMVSSIGDSANDNGAALVVANTLRGLEDLARASRARSHAKILAVTGSAGKTTTKEMLRLACGALGLTHASTASYNNHWGVPFSLAAMPRETEYGVFEIGMNHPGEIRALVSIVKPDVAVITTVAAAHLEFFGSCEAIADAKSEIFEGVVPGGAAIIPADNPYTGRLRARARQANLGNVLLFGTGTGADGRICSIDDTPEGMRVEAVILGRDVHLRLRAHGAHLASNAVAALLTVAVVNGDVLNAAAALSDFDSLKGRGARTTLPFGAGTIDVIDEGYNANPASMSAALDVLSRVKPGDGGRRIAVLGDMLELGAQAPQLHAGLARDIETAQIDLVCACGPQMRNLWDALPVYRRGVFAADSGALAPEVIGILRAGDVVLVKGSFGSRMERVIEAIRTRAAEGAA
ncbi:MAG: UDP-N-acetylmuramoylalanyl-D-glutamyl-2,6-diaminopimelate--D-alanyl-D-alanine ligase [Alphaproteobacteria bacterium]|nr:UDP-N-acetylmuramoylalanyl-D-glutamyl-2,6-diaminopimelate--D-alanyl-D-alanine ligase [Alphaproteobacteria bacterium]